jgi:hypothetical protein
MNKEQIESFYQIPCGPLGVSADGVCRRGLKDSYDKLLDRLSKELHPVETPDSLPKGLRADGNKIVKFEEESLEEKKEKLIRDGKIKAEAKLAVKRYEEELQGNSKLLQNVSGKIEPH